MYLVVHEDKARGEAIVAALDGERAARRGLRPSWAALATIALILWFAFIQVQLAARAFPGS